MGDSPVPQGLPPPPRRDRTLHPQEAGARGSQTEGRRWASGRGRAADGRQDGRRPGRLPEGAGRRCRRGQGGRRRAGVGPDEVQGRLREGQDRVMCRSAMKSIKYILKVECSLCYSLSTKLAEDINEFVMKMC